MGNAMDFYVEQNRELLVQIQISYSICNVCYAFYTHELLLGVCIVSLWSCRSSL